ncbi:hypothetical protein CUMW_219430, partial [Citrus unshiu]
MIEFSRNQFSGGVSVDFSRLKNLSWLNLGVNNLGSGTANELDFINLLTNCSKLERLYFNRNGFEGVLPHSIANLSSTIKQIAMGSNRISSTIPHGIRNLVNLNWLTMESSQLIGTIPPLIGETPNLQLLNIGGNHLQGSILSSLGNLTLQTYLFNNLQGNIPSSLANCKSLLGLSVSHNKLTSTLPQQILSVTTLSLYLELDNNLLNGSLPPEVGNLKNLLRLHIPEYPENLSFFELLNLSYNYFGSEVPTKGVFNNKTRFSIIGNGKLCGGLDELHLPSCRYKGSIKPSITSLKVLIPVIVSCLILLVISFIFYARRKKPAHKDSNMLSMKQQFPMISHAELSKATNNFSPANKIREGGFNIVYNVAMKVANLKQKEASRSFAAEFNALRNIRHRNLIKIITICSSIDFEGFDFKAISNGQLRLCNLSLTQRVNIAIDVAFAIEYLRHHCQPSIVHGDLKPSNILLDQDVVTHVGDLGLAKFLYGYEPGTTAETASSSIGINGTVGYVAPVIIAARNLENREKRHTVMSFPQRFALNEKKQNKSILKSAGIKGKKTVSFFLSLLSPSCSVFPLTPSSNSFTLLGLRLPSRSSSSFVSVSLATTPDLVDDRCSMFTRRRPTDARFNGLTLHEFVKMALPDKVMEIVDPSLLL